MLTLSPAPFHSIASLAVYSNTPTPLHLLCLLHARTLQSSHSVLFSNKRPRLALFTDLVLMLHVGPRSDEQPKAVLLAIDTCADGGCEAILNSHTRIHPHWEKNTTIKQSSNRADTHMRARKQENIQARKYTNDNAMLLPSISISR